MMCTVDSDQMARAVAEAHDKYLHDVASFKEEGRQEGISIGQAMAAEEILRLRKIIESAGLSVDET